MEQLLNSQSKKGLKIVVDVMLVEDDHSQIVLIKKSFKRSKLADLDYKLTIKRNGQDAIDSLDTGYRPNFILADIKMPIMNGIELLKKLKESALKRIPVIILTTSELEANEAYEAGASFYLLKPVNFRELDNVVKALGILSKNGRFPKWD